MSDEISEEIQDAIKITSTQKSLRGGIWVDAQCLGYRIQALVFSHHADDPSTELGHSRITKFWVQRISNREEVYNWDRGLDKTATAPDVEAIVDTISDCLADFLFCGTDAA